jgi:hypothetical protein
MNTLGAEVKIGETVVSAQIYSSSDRYLRVLVAAPVSMGMTIQVKFEDSLVRGTVVFCQKVFGGYQVGVELMNEDGSVYRREPRFTVDGSGSLSVLGTEGPKGLKIDLADVSSSGIGIYLDRPLAEQTCVYLRVANSAIFGEVRNCDTAGRRGFRLGIRIDIFVPATGTQDAVHSDPQRKHGFLGLFGFKLRK